MWLTLPYVGHNGAHIQMQYISYTWNSAFYKCHTTYITTKIFRFPHFHQSTMRYKTLKLYHVNAEWQIFSFARASKRSLYNSLFLSISLVSFFRMLVRDTCYVAFLTRLWLYGQIDLRVRKISFPLCSPALWMDGVPHDSRLTDFHADT